MTPKIDKKSVLFLNKINLNVKKSTLVNFRHKKTRRKVGLSGLHIQRKRSLEFHHSFIKP